MQLRYIKIQRKEKYCTIIFKMMIITIYGEKMSEFTFETGNRTHKYETYEWDNTWIDHPNDGGARILYIGDSISCGIRHGATEQAGGKMVFDLFGTSRAVDNPYFKDALRVFAYQEGRRDAIIFNNGLHGWHLDDETDFKKYYEDMIRFLCGEFAGTPLAVVLSTYIKKEEDVKRVMARNKAVCEIAQAYNIPVIDLFSVSRSIKELLNDDGVHFTAEGYMILAKKIVESAFDLICK